MESNIRVGYSRHTIHPEESIPLSGFSNEPKRFHTAITEDICATCVAITDEKDTTVLMISLDVVRLVPYFGETCRQRVSQATGIPQERVYIAATHTHSGPGLSMESYPCIQRYAEKFYQELTQASLDALADRKPAQMSVGSIETYHMNFIKHYRCRDNKTGQISYIGDQYGSSEGKTIVDHATQVDPTMHLLRFTREGGKDVVVANFRAHPHFTGGYKKYDLSSDYIGAFRMALEAMVDCHAVYFQGACGNVNSASRMVAERKFTTCRSYGTALAAYAAECLGKYMRPAESGMIKTKQLKYYGQINMPDEKLREAAQKVAALWKETYDRKLCGEVGEPLGIHSPYHANATLANYKRTSEQDGWMILNAVSIGEDYAFVTFPGEMYDSISVRMEDNSPFPMTMMLGYCYHHLGYLPSAKAYQYGSYEVDITRFAPGTGEMVADTQVQMLKELKNS